jgi:hypothetical protein
VPDVLVSLAEGLPGRADLARRRAITLQAGSHTGGPGSRSGPLLAITAGQTARNGLCRPPGCWVPLLPRAERPSGSSADETAALGSALPTSSQHIASLTPVERVAAPARHRVLSHVRPWRLRVKGTGQRILSKRQRPRRGGQDALNPLTLSAAGSSSGRQERQPPQEACKALPRAGCEAPTGRKRCRMSPQIRLLFVFLIQIAPVTNHMPVQDTEKRKVNLQGQLIRSATYPCREESLGLLPC